MKKDFLPENITLKSIQLVFRSSPAMCRAFIAFELVFCLIPIFSAKAISQIVTIFGTLSVSKYTDLGCYFLHHHECWDAGVISDSQSYFQKAVEQGRKRQRDDV